MSDKTFYKLSPSDSKLVHELAEIRNEKKILEKREEEIAKKLLTIAKESGCDGLEGPSFLLTLRQSTSVSWKSVAEELSAPPSLVLKHTKAGDFYLVASGPLFK